VEDGPADTLVVGNRAAVSEDPEDTLVLGTIPTGTRTRHRGSMVRVALTAVAATLAVAVAAVPVGSELLRPTRDAVDRDDRAAPVVRAPVPTRTDEPSRSPPDPTP
jgi:hypothetical protein